MIEKIERGLRHAYATNSERMRELDKSDEIIDTLNGLMQLGLAVTLATNRLLGRTTAGTGAVEQIAVASSLTLAAQLLSVSDPLTLATLNLTKEVKSPATEVTMSGTLTLIAGTHTTYQFLDPNGSDRDVNLPVAALGLTYFIWNTGSANNLVVKDSGGTPITGGTISFGQNRSFIYSGSAWRCW